MKRREFITLLGGAAALAARRARAAAGQAADHRVPGRGHACGLEPWTAAFVQRLRELGWIEGRTVAIEYRWAEGRSERFAEIAAEFVRLKVDVIVTVGKRGPARQSRRHRSSRSSSRWRTTRLAAAWSRAWRDRAATSPDCRIQAPDLAGKRLELLREVAPGLRRLAILANVGYPASVLEMGEVEARPARSASTSPDSKSGAPRISRPPSRRSRAARMRFMSVADPLVNANRIRINTLGARRATADDARHSRSTSKPAV